MCMETYGYRKHGLSMCAPYTDVGFLYYSLRPFSPFLSIAPVPFFFLFVFLLFCLVFASFSKSTGIVHGYLNGSRREGDEENERNMTVRMRIRSIDLTKRNLVASYDKRFMTAPLFLDECIHRTETYFGGFAWDRDLLLPLFQSTRIACQHK